MAILESQYLEICYSNTINPHRCNWDLSNQQKYLYRNPDDTDSRWNKRTRRRGRYN